MRIVRREWSIIIIMESLVKGPFDEDPDRAMARSEWEAVAEDSAKKASDARELLRLKKKEEDELKARAKAITPATALQIIAQAAQDSLIDDGFGDRRKNRQKKSTRPE